MHFRGVNGGLEDIAIVADQMARACAAGTCDPATLAAWMVGVIRSQPVRCGPLEIHPIDRAIMREGKIIPLLPREHRLLLHLALHRGVTVSRDALLAAVWGLSFDPGTNVVAVHMSRLRSRVDHGFDRPLIETVPRAGYRLVA